MGFFSTHQKIFAIFAISLVSEIAAQSNYAESTCACRARKYLIIDQTVTFFKAIGQCRDQGMELATPQNVFELEEVARTLREYTEKKNITSQPENSAWLGAHRCSDCVTPKGFIWLNTGSPVLISNFSGPNPDNVNVQDCLRQIYTTAKNWYTGGGWDDIQCSNKYFSLCQSRCCNN